MRKQAGGYFTVEAAMVMPVVLGVIVFIMYLLFFQYNRCLLEQDIGVLAMRGAALQAENNEDRIDKLRQQAEEVYREKYIVWRGGEIQIRLERGKLEVKQSGAVMSPGGGSWTTEACYENQILSPTTFIRTYRKLKKE